MNLITTLFYATFLTSIQAHQTPDLDLSTENLTPNPNDPPLPLPTPQIIYDLRAMLTGFVLCDTSPFSPSADDAVTAIQSLRARVHSPAQQKQLEPPFCTELTVRGHAAAAICGPHGTWMKSKDAGKMADQVYRRCKGEYGEETKVGGVYVFNEWTEPRSEVRVYRVGGMDE